MKAALANVPADAAAFVCLPNLKALDGDVQRAITSLGLDMFVPPPMNSVVTMIKMNLPMLAGLDESQPVALVVMPVKSMAEMDAHTALLFSASDPKAVLEGMGGTVNDEGVWAINVMGQSQLAALNDHKIVIGKDAEVVQAIAKSTTSVVTTMNKGELAALDALDLAVWINGERLFTPLKPMINGMLMMVMMQAQSSGAMTPEMMDQNRKQLEEVIDGLGSVLVGVSVQDAGIGIRGAMTAKPKSTFAAKMKIKTTTGSLFTGLPGSTFIAAYGQIMDPELVKTQLDQMDPLAKMATDAGVDEAHAKKLVAIIKEAVVMLEGVRFSVTGLDSEKSGLLGLSGVIATTDAPRMIELDEQAFGIIKDMVKQAAAKSDDVDADTVSDVLALLTFKRDAETIGGVKVSQFRVDHEKLAELTDGDEEDVATLLRIVGEEGILFRVGAVNKSTLITAFGGGPARFAKLVAAARSNNAPLDDNVGIKNVSGNLPKARASVFFVDANEIMAAAQRVSNAAGQQPLPVQLPKLDAPLAMASTGGNGWARVDLFVPTALIRGIKDAAMAGAAASGQQ